MGGIARRLNTACDTFAADANQFTDRGRGLRRGCDLDIATARDLSADRGDGFTAVFTGSPHMRHQRLERPEPEVIGVPPVHFVEPAAIDPARTIAAVRSACRLGVLGLRVGP